MSTRIGEYIRTIPEIQAIDMANKAQLADTIAYFKKSQQYNNGDIHNSVVGSITPAVCKALNPPLKKEDFQNGFVYKLNQYVLRKIYNYFTETPYYSKCSNSPKKLEKGLKLWWAYDGRKITDKVKTELTADASDGGNFRNTVQTKFKDLKEKDNAERYTELFKDL